MKEQYWIRPDTAEFKSVWADMQATRKSLTNTECAAEMWRAEADMATNAPTVMSPAVVRKHIRTWQRFATHPHARDKDYQ